MDGNVPMYRWVRLKKHCADTGATPEAVHARQPAMLQVGGGWLFRQSGAAAPVPCCRSRTSPECRLPRRIGELMSQSGTYDHPLFGRVGFHTIDPDWIRGGEIEFESGGSFSKDMVTPLFLPQVVGIPRSSDDAINNGHIVFHEDAHQQLLDAFAELERRGLLHVVRSFGGWHFQPRLRKAFDKDGNKIMSRLPSNHSFGTAFDINAREGHGESAKPLAPVFRDFGFKWGGDFNDPMHFEVEQFR